MTTYVGRDGYISINSSEIIEVSSFTLDISVGTTDDTVIGDEWETHKITQKSWTASAELFWDETDASQQALEIGATVAASLQPMGNNSGDFAYTGNATVESKSVAAAKDGIVSQSVSLKGNGPINEGVV